MTAWTFPQLEADLRRLADAIGQRPVLFHTDIAAFGMPTGVSGRRALLDGWADALLAAFAGRTLLFPTFTYDWCRTGHFDVLHDPGKVGTLNEWLRLRHPTQRTATPVFNFLILGDGFRRTPVRNVFGPESTFAELIVADAVQVHLGSAHASGTIGHHHEELLEVPYRYLKSFPGTLNEGGTSRPFAIDYRVRPRGAVLTYDHDKGAQAMARLGISVHQPVVGLPVEWFPLAANWAFIRDQMTRDRHYLLDAASCREAETLYARYGTPLTWAAVEAASSS
jgi:aminoglycoside N3'-acetyltransferase